MSAGEGAPPAFVSVTDLVSVWRALTQAQRTYAADLLDAAGEKIRDEYRQAFGTEIDQSNPAARTVSILEDAGLAGLHLEDQVNPKRCGHLDGKAVVPVDEAVRRLRAAVATRRDSDFVICARTDAAGIEGIDAAIDRAKAYADAGADLIFTEALHTTADFERFRSAVDTPLLANMTEFGKSDLIDAGTLESIGYDAVIYPVTTLRLAMFAAEEGLRAIAAEGTQSGLLDRMQHRSRLYELLQYERYNDFDSGIFTFTLTRSQ